MLADYHVHTAYSDDCDTPMEAMAGRAVDMGLDEICFTEHVDYDVPDVVTCDYDAYFQGLEITRRRYGDRVAIRTGIEFGVQMETVEKYRRDFQAYPFDFVLLSCHQVDGKELCRYQFQAGKTQDEYQRAFYQATYDVMRVYKDYSVLAHLDMIKRYDPCGAYPDEKILPLVEQILRQAIADGKGIEVNTSSFRYGLPDLTPSRAILELYRDLGGRVLTIGSDAHETAHLGDHVPEVRRILREMGFREFCTFESMKPVFHPL